MTSVPLFKGATGATKFCAYYHILFPRSTLVGDRPGYFDGGCAAGSNAQGHGLESTGWSYMRATDLPRLADQRQEGRPAR